MYAMAGLVTVVEGQNVGRRGTKEKRVVLDRSNGSTSGKRDEPLDVWFDCVQEENAIAALHDGGQRRFVRLTRKSRLRSAKPTLREENERQSRKSPPRITRGINDTTTV